MRKFYSWHIAIQWILAVIMLVAALAMIKGWLNLMDKHFLYFLGIFISVPLLQFLMTPFFRLIGVYHYLSPMLLVFGRNKKRYDIHNGTSFDYMVHLWGLQPGAPIRHRILSYYVEGLLEIIRRIEAGELPETLIVRGSSYFMSERSIERMGFKLSNTGIFEKMNILINYIDLLWMYSLAHGGIRLPDLRAIKTASIAGKDLVLSKNKLISLHNFLCRDN